MIRAVKFVSVYVNDQDVALDFYTQKLGFTIVTDQPMGPGARWIELRIPGAETSVVIAKPMMPEHKVGVFQNMALVADDVQKTYDELVDRGVHFRQPPRTEPWGTSAIFEDPDGNVFVLSSR
ncbi:MAG TPA: VOC family protein [Longimicrobium sp.]|jgi:predicted enzyme related to lactoylglutathione lyase|uniref:VOC family protein n=1 Tax=Longimicrobium sp. TaxID=2029185 RepID=UPI002ED934E2